MALLLLFPSSPSHGAVDQACNRVLMIIDDSQAHVHIYLQQSTDTVFVNMQACKVQ